MSQMNNTFISLFKMKKTPLLAVLLLIALAVFMLLPKSDKGEVQAQMPGGKELPPTLVRVETVGTLDGTQPIPKVGTVAAKETVQIVPRVSGYLTKVAFQEGDFVKEGDLLFEIEDTIYQINVDIAESVIKQIEAEIALAQRNHDRTKQLVKTRAATEQDVDEALRNVNLQEARKMEAEARLKQAETDLGYTKIYAPLSGRIGAKQFSEGNYLTPASGVLATIMQFDPIRVTFPVTEREFTTYFQKNGENKDANIEVILANGKPYQGDFSIDFLDNYVDRFTGQIMIYLVCGNEDNKLYPGGFSTVKLSEHFEEPRPATNVSALMTDGATHYVYVVDKANKVERRNVVLGSQVFDRQIITSGLTPGERVVVGGLNKIAPEQTITPLEVPSPAAKVEQEPRQLAEQKPEPQAESRPEMQTRPEPPAVAALPVVAVTEDAENAVAQGQTPVAVARPVEQTPAAIARPVTAVRPAVPVVQPLDGASRPAE